MASKKSDKVKVVIGFDADLSKVGKTVELTAEEARVKVAEGRARYADDKDHAAAPTGPTTTPPLPQVAGPPTAVAIDADKAAPGDKKS